MIEWLKTQANIPPEDEPMVMESIQKRLEDSLRFFFNSGCIKIALKNNSTVLMWVGVDGLLSTLAQPTDEEKQLQKEGVFVSFDKWRC